MKQSMMRNAILLTLFAVVAVGRAAAAIPEELDVAAHAWLVLQNPGCVL